MITQFDYRILKFIKERKVVMLVDLMMKTGKTKREVHELLYQLYIPKDLVCLVGMEGIDKSYKLTGLGEREVEIYEDYQKNNNLMNQKDNCKVVQKDNWWTILKKGLNTI